MLGKDAEDVVECRNYEIFIGTEGVAVSGVDSGETHGDGLQLIVIKAGIEPRTISNQVEERRT